MSKSLEDCPFSYLETKQGAVQIFCRNRMARTLRGKEALQFMDKVANADTQAQQLLMARVTGQFKFGNERLGKEKSRP